jgi:hypothetical protein
MRTGDTNKRAHHQTTSNLSLFRVSVGDSPQTPTRPTSPDCLIGPDSLIDITNQHSTTYRK